jgi:signal transduction histidine kinase
MKSLRWRLTLWFAVSLLVVVAVLAVSGLWHLDYELRQEKWERTHPAHPDWVLHGSFTEKEVRDILGELIEFWVMVGVPLAGLALLSAHLLARKSTRPVRELNQQLVRLGATTLDERIKVPDADPEIGELVRHLNELLARLEAAFNHLRDYTTQVAHELRTPLQLMRLQIESNAVSMSPELAENLQEELLRLSNYVESALTIARAEQGRLETHPETVLLKSFLEDAIEPFTRLAAVEKRRLLWSCPHDAEVWTDRSTLKQILFNLLTNALKHGDGDILFRVRPRSQAVAVLVGNRLAAPNAGPKQGLGIGLRLVCALAQQLGQTRVTFRRGRFFWARLQLPAAPTTPTVAAGRSV